MAVVNYMPFTRDEIPIGKIFEIDDLEFTYEINYNETFDFYTLIVRDADDEVIYTSKLVYNNDALHAAHYFMLVLKTIKPFDYSGNHNVLNYETFGDKVKIYVG